MNYSLFAVPFLPPILFKPLLYVALPKPNFMPPHNFFAGKKGGRFSYRKVAGERFAARCSELLAVVAMSTRPAPRCSFSFLILLYIPDASPHPLFALSSPLLLCGGRRQIRAVFSVTPPYSEQKERRQVPTDAPLSGINNGGEKTEIFM